MLLLFLPLSCNLGLRQLFPVFRQLLPGVALWLIVCMGNVLEEVLLTRSSQLSIRRGGENVLLYILGPSCFSKHNEKLFKNCYRLGSMCSTRSQCF